MMPVYNGIEYDGRVQRAADAISDLADVVVLALDAGRSDVESTWRFAVRRVPVPGSGSKWARHRLFWHSVLTTARALRPAVIHAHDYFMAGPGRLAAAWAGAAFVYDAHELVIPSPDERMGARERIWYTLEASVVRQAHLVIAANQERAELMRCHYRLRRTPTVVRNIPPAPQTAGGEQVRSRMASNRPVQLVYQGDLALSRGIGLFVDAVAALGPDFELKLIGGGPDTRQLEDRIRQAGAEGWITLLGRVPAAALPRLLASADLGVICYADRGLNNRFCAPNKLYEYAQAGLPMVGKPNPVIEAAFNRYGVGISRSDIREAILEASRRLPELRAGLPHFLASHRWADEADQLRRAYRESVPGFEQR